MTQQVIDLARSLAERAHEGQLDKIGVAYIEHPRMVAEMVQAVPAFAEVDSHTQRDAVVALTRRADIPDETYYETIRGNPVALLVKTADIASNLHPSRVAQLDVATRARLARKYADALAKLHVDPSVSGMLHGG